MSDKQIVAVVDDAPLKESISAAAGALGYDVEYAGNSPGTPEDIIQRLVARQPALIIVDLEARTANWRQWIVTAKTNPSTRRIPVIAFGPLDDGQRPELARQSGSDVVLGKDDFKSNVAAWIQRYARNADHEHAELLRQSALPPSDLLRKGIHEFNAGAYFEQHETLESAWRAEPGPIRQLYQGILQIGVAYYQIHRRNYAGAIKMFQRAWQYLNPLPGICQGVNVAQLRADAHAAQLELERLGPARIAEYNPVFLKPIQIQ